MNPVAAGITLYQPDIERLRKNITRVLPQVGRLYLVNNASDGLDALRRTYAEDPRVCWIENAENGGTARALNQMCRAAAADGFAWILTLDQDSVIEERLIEKYARYTDRPEVGLITPCFIDENDPQDVTVTGSAPYESVHRCITSASLVRLSAFEQAGGFDEVFFIDYVDFDFCTALEEAGYTILRDNEAVVFHQLGRARRITCLIPLGRLFRIRQLQKPLFTYNHSPQRTYYYARNTLYYIYKHRRSIDLPTERRTYIRWIMLKLLFEKQRLQKLRAILRGRRDARKMIAQLEQQNRK